MKKIRLLEKALYDIETKVEWKVKNWNQVKKEKLYSK